MTFSLLEGHQSLSWGLGVIIGLGVFGVMAVEGTKNPTKRMFRFLHYVLLYNYVYTGIYYCSGILYTVYSRLYRDPPINDDGDSTPRVIIPNDSSFRITGILSALASCHEL